MHFDFLIRSLFEEINLLARGPEWPDRPRGRKETIGFIYQSPFVPRYRASHTVLADGNGISQLPQSTPGGNYPLPDVLFVNKSLLKRNAGGRISA
jgi:hypothetical protein